MFLELFNYPPLNANNTLITNKLRLAQTANNHSFQQKSNIRHYSKWKIRDISCFLCHFVRLLHFLDCFLKIFITFGAVKCNKTFFTKIKLKNYDFVQGIRSCEHQGDVRKGN